MYQVANRDFGLKNYIIIVLSTVLAVFGAYAFDFYFMGANSGILMGLLEVTFEAFMFWKLHQLHLKSNKKIYRFKWFFFFLGIGDFFYMLFFYFLKLSSRQWYSLLLITVPYSIAYFFGAFIVLGGNLKSGTLFRSKLAISVYLFCIPLVMRLLVIPFVDNVGVSDGIGFVIVESMALTGLYFLLCHSVMTLIASNSFFWSNISSAMIVLVVSDWALRVEKLIDNSPTFGFYEGLYCLGVSMMVASFIDLKRIPSVLRYDSMSLSSNVKKITVAAVCASTIFLSLSQYGTRESIRFGILSVIFGVFLVQMIGIYINEQINSFTKRVSRLADEKTIVIDRKSARVMPIELLAAFRQVVNLQVKLIREKIVLENKNHVQEKLSEKAAQVSHDIRSPLAALEMVVGQLGELPEDKRLLVRNSVHRIRDIANDLLFQNKSIIQNGDGISKNIDNDSEKFESVLLEPVVESIVSEKRIRYREHVDVEIVFDLSHSSYGLFAYVQPLAFKRVVSNLLNNALESLVDHKGKVRVSLGLVPDQQRMISIRIEDSGIGMDQTVVDRLGEKGFTFGKDGGSGIGLNFSISKIRAMGGDVQFESKIGKGTTVLVNIPACQSPSWSVSALRIIRSSTVVIVDDDQSIHDVWNRRFDFSDQNSDLKILHFSSPTEFSSCFKDDSSVFKNALFLVDYEFNGFAENGLEMIEGLGVQSQSILVTSHFEDRMVLDRCLLMGVKVIPKMMAGFVPVYLV
jgi:signal transduction histidine kinase